MSLDIDFHIIYLIYLLSKALLYHINNFTNLSEKTLYNIYDLESVFPLTDRTQLRLSNLFTDCSLVKA